MIAKPEASEYNSYYGHYVSLVEGENIIRELKNGIDLVNDIYGSISGEWGDYAYSEGKWTLKQMLQHIIDSERIFNFRVVSIVRREPNPLPGFDHDAYAQVGNAHYREVNALVEEFTHVRNSTVSLFNSILEEDWAVQGVANGSNVSVRALAYIICGHLIHHMQIVKERYGAAFNN